MSNKFLPFVVENSTPIHIFKTLLSRSKGMNQVLIASIFNLILNRDIKTLREKVKELPDMSLEKVYEELLIKYPQYRVKDEVLATYQTIVEFFPDECVKWNSEFDKFSLNDSMIFFCGMSYANKEIDSYTEFSYDLIMNGDTSDKILGNIKKYVHFSDKGISIAFDNVIVLRCFILYHGLFRSAMDPEGNINEFCASIDYVKQ